MNTPSTATGEQLANALHALGVKIHHGWRKWERVPAQATCTFDCRPSRKQQVSSALIAHSSVYGTSRICCAPRRGYKKFKSSAAAHASMLLYCGGLVSKKISFPSGCIDREKIIPARLFLAELGLKNTKTPKVTCDYWRNVIKH